MNKMKINEVIQSKRKALNMTQMQLAEKLDVSDKTISRWELGNIYPNVDMIPKIALVLGISINELFGNNANIPVNTSEKRDYRKIIVLKIFFYCFIVSSIISAILFLMGIENSESDNNKSKILIISSVVFFIIALISYYIKRVLFSTFYKDKFYINEYKRLDANLTVIVNSIASVITGGLYLFSPNILVISLLVFMMFYLANLFFLKKLEFTFNKKAIIFSILGSIIYLGFVLLFIYSHIGHPVINFIQFLIFITFMHIFFLLSFLLSINKK